MPERKNKSIGFESCEKHKPLATTHSWQFVSRFRRQAFGWRSEIPIKRIKEAVSEIKMVERNDPKLAAEGAVKFLGKISPAIDRVDSSSGAIGGAVNYAIEALVPIITNANVDLITRQKWLEQLWTAFEDDKIPYLESLGDFWGELCANRELASKWADEFLPLAKHVLNPQTPGHSFYNGTTPCLSSLFAAGRYDELQALLAQAPFKFWHYRKWGVRTLLAQGKKEEALRYAEGSRSLNEPDVAISRICEEILLSSGHVDEAYKYALEANQKMTNLATFRAIAKKYPRKSPEDIIRDLAAIQPGLEGKWFAAAKDAKLFALAIELVKKSPTEPKTLIRAARDFTLDRPDFAMASGLAALHWISLGQGYEITGLDVLEAFSCVKKASQNIGMDERQMKELICKQISAGDHFVRKILSDHLSV